MRIGPAGIWGVLGFAALLGQAIYRLSGVALAGLRMPFDAIHWAALTTWVVFAAWSEGYRAFQKQVAPRVVARAQYLTRHPRALFAALAPLYCMGLIHATRRRLVTSWCVLLGIVGLVIAVRQLHQPWRGIVDAGVVIGLAWGVVAIAVYFVRGLRAPLAVSPEVPEP